MLEKLGKARVVHIISCDYCFKNAEKRFLNGKSLALKEKRIFRASTPNKPELEMLRINFSKHNSLLQLI